MNKLYLIVTSFFEKKEDISRLFDSLGVHSQITVLFVNQSLEDSTDFLKKYEQKIHIIELKSGGHIPLSVARNKALHYLYNDDRIIDENTLLLFTDDDAWFPVDTIDYLLGCEIQAFTLRCKDPDLNKSFMSYQKKGNGLLNVKDIITDIVSISLVVPFRYLKNSALFFKEDLGLGTVISQGEETFFSYQLYLLGCRFYRLNYFIYHPYKKNFSERNFYSFAYFLSSFIKYISPVFRGFLFFFILKYSVACLLGLKDRRYLLIAKSIYKGYLDGKKDIYFIFKGKP